MYDVFQLILGHVHAGSANPPHFCICMHAFIQKSLTSRQLDTVEGNMECPNHDYSSSTYSYVTSGTHVQHDAYTQAVDWSEALWVFLLFGKASSPVHIFFFVSLATWPPFWK